jgi:hypothetical protein
MLLSQRRLPQRGWLADVEKSKRNSRPSLARTPEKVGQSLAARRTRDVLDHRLNSSMCARSTPWCYAEAMESEAGNSSRPGRGDARNLRDIIDALPGRSSVQTPVLHLEPLPNDVLPELELPDLTAGEAPPPANR